MTRAYIEPHLHTHYSVLDSVIGIKEYVKFGVENSLEALFITDHGSMGGVLKFYKECKSNNIKPIIGCEFYTTEDLPTEEKKTKDNNHIILIAKNTAGYKNLLKLSKLACDNFYYHPRLTKELIKEYSEGLICSSACIGSLINHNIISNNLENAEELVDFYKDVFGDDFYLELQSHESKDMRVINEEKNTSLKESQLKVNETLIKFGIEKDIKLIVSNDAHYLKREDSLTQEAILCKGDNMTLSSPKRYSFSNDQFFYKTREQIYESFGCEGDTKFLDQCIDNVYDIVDKCSVDPVIIETGINRMPIYTTPKGQTEEDYLKDLIMSRVKNRYGKITPQIRDRVKEEFDTFKSMSFCGYILIVYDIIEWCNSQSIPVGTGRGSVGGSIIAYILGITDVCPLQYKLLFERFLNPERFSMCDIDIDICKSRRQEVIDYIVNKYGEENTSKIITYGTMKAKGAVKFACKVLDVPFDKASNITKLISDKADSIKSELEGNKSLSDIAEKNKNVFSLAQALEGSFQSIGEHPSGIVISPVETSTLAPYIKKKDTVMTCFDMDDLEAVGLIKFDILGLQNLSIIKETIDTIKRTQNKDVNIREIPRDDEKTYRLLSNGHSVGIFQFESKGMQALLKCVKPETIAHLGACVSLYRPGPMSINAHTEYWQRKEGVKSVVFEHELLEDILKDTYGLIIYQEQVMQISRKLAGYTFTESDELRKGIGKKKKEIIEEHREKFVNGCVSNGVDEEFAKKLYTDIEGFGAYCFNMSHAIEYALISYQTAYLKANYPLEYMTSLLNGSESKDDLNKYLNECYNIGLKVEPVCINNSSQRFTVYEDKIIFGLEGVANIGATAIRNILRARKSGSFTSFYDFLERVQVTKTVIENLIKVSAFRSVENNHKIFLQLTDCVTDAKQMKEYIDKDISLELALKKTLATKLCKEDEKYKQLKLELAENKGQKKEAKENRVKINSKIEELLYSHLGSIDKVMMCSDFDKREIIQNEMDILSYSITHNQLSFLEKVKPYIDHTPIDYILDSCNGKVVNTIGMIKKINEYTIKQGKNKGDQMAYIDIEYNMSTLSCTLWSDVWKKYKNILKQGDSINVCGEFRDNESNNGYGDTLIISNLKVYRIVESQDSSVVINIDGKDKKWLSGIAQKLNSEYKNSSEIKYITYLQSNGQRKMLNEKYWLNNYESIVSYI